MDNIELFAYIVFGIQFFHSIEELLTGFHKKWYLVKLPFNAFLLFEICFTIFWGIILYFEAIPIRYELLAFYLILMFANGVQHVVWWGSEKKYVPGLYTAILHILVFLIFYLRTI